MIDLNTCKWVVYGLRDHYHTHRHIHEGFYRALRHLGRQVQWIDPPAKPDDCANTFFITANMVNLHNMPTHPDSLYAIHNIDDRVKATFGDLLGRMSVLNFGVLTSTTVLGPHDTLVEHESYFSLQPWERYSSVQFRWGTDLLPHEIEANKPTKVFRNDSREVNYIGTPVDEVLPFQQACKENGIEFNQFGGYSGKPPVSIEENVRLIKQSYMAPSISDTAHCISGYVPCRVFKNISYGQPVMTNNRFSHELFRERLIFNSDVRELFYHAREILRDYPISTLHFLMDEVAEKHTYLNSINALRQAAKLMLENRKISC